MSKGPSWKGPLIMAILLAVGGGTAYWLEFTRKPVVEEKEEMGKRVFRIKDTPISTVQIVDGEKHFAFRCTDSETKLCKAGDNSKWEITEPAKFKADDTNVNSLLSAIETLDGGEALDLSSESPEKRASLLKEY